MSKSIKLEQPKLIIGEGQEEKILFSTLIKYLNIGNIQVESYGGKGNLGKFLKTLHLIPGYQQLQSLGITRDADDSFDSAFTSIKNFIQANLNPDDLNVFTFIMPDNSSPGMLEDLCLASIKPEEIQCAETFLACISSCCNRTPKNLAKAKIHTWLASQINPGQRLGEAAQSGCLDWEHPAFQQLRAFVQNL
ncbi:DUF3226 domain-containing protein [Spirulina sp. CCNP1310]|uniref:DUF3226 domain-containing protein n=1 Tax=Spirulina sp. CCNP1310 TaxID=3110249 RepID=UPI002B1EB4CC|nr:DUF3226 domain-containing protein [Spirulina sp. CCNP1310]MEA5418310.1 DUF3226 domain-containing protein [Spirulina sp. CCNP1310]